MKTLPEGKDSDKEGEGSHIELSINNVEPTPAEETSNKDEMTKQPKYKLNHCYLFAFTLTFTCASAVQAGILFNECGMTSYVFSQKLGWTEDGSQDTNSTLLVTIAFLGVAIGSLIE